MRQASETFGRWIRRATWALALLAVLYLGADLLLPGAARPVSQTSSFAATAVSQTSADALAVPFAQSSSSSTTHAPFEAQIQQDAETTPTYVSELAPAVMIAPPPAATLPATGAKSDGSQPWPKLAGLAMALLGVLFIYTALTFHTSKNG